MHPKQGFVSDAPHCEQSKHHQLRQWYDHKSTGPTSTPNFPKPAFNKLRPPYLLDHTPSLHQLRVSQFDDLIRWPRLKDPMVRKRCAVPIGSYITSEDYLALDCDEESNHTVKWDSWMPGRSECETRVRYGIEESNCEAVLHVSSWQSNQVSECSSRLVPTCLLKRTTGHGFRHLWIQWRAWRQFDFRSNQAKCTHHEMPLQW